MNITVQTKIGDQWHDVETYTGHGAQQRAQRNVDRQIVTRLDRDIWRLTNKETGQVWRASGHLMDDMWFAKNKEVK